MRTVLRLWFTLAVLFLASSANSAEPNTSPAEPLKMEANALGHFQEKRAVCGVCECHLKADKKKASVSSIGQKVTIEERCHELVTRFVVPTYPPLARTAAIQGVVFVQVQIDPKGNVLNAEPIEGHPMLVKSAVDAVLNWKFRPSEMLVKMVSIRFEMTDNPELNPPRARVNPPDELHIVGHFPTLENSTRAKTKNRSRKPQSSAR